MSPIQAIRAFNKVWGPKADALAVAAQADAGFDGGEFSGPAYGYITVRVFEETLAAVAERFGLTAAELDNAIQQYERDQQQRWQEVQA
jgi:hypothetical protein